MRCMPILPPITRIERGMVAPSRACASLSLSLWDDRFCRPRDQRHQMTSFILQFWIGVGVTIMVALVHLPFSCHFRVGIGAAFMRLPFLFHLGIGERIAFVRLPFLFQLGIGER